MKWLLNSPPKPHPLISLPLTNYINSSYVAAMHVALAVTFMNGEWTAEYMWQFHQWGTALYYQSQLDIINTLAEGQTGMTYFKIWALVDAHSIPYEPEMKVQFYVKLNEIFQSLPVGVRGDILKTLPGYTGSPHVVGSMLENYILKCGINSPISMQIISQITGNAQESIVWAANKSLALDSNINSLLELKRQFGAEVMWKKVAESAFLR